MMNCRNSTRAVERHFLLLLVGAPADPQRHRHLVPGEERLQEALHGLRVIGCVSTSHPSSQNECSRRASFCAGYRLVLLVVTDWVGLIELDFGSFQLVVKYPNPSRHNSGPYPPEPPCNLNLMSIDQTPERSINSFRTRCRRAGSASFGRRGGSATSTGAKTPRFSPPSRTDGSGLQQVNLAYIIPS